MFSAHLHAALSTEYERDALSRGRRRPQAVAPRIRRTGRRRSAADA